MTPEGCRTSNLSAPFMIVIVVPGPLRMSLKAATRTFVFAPRPISEESGMRRIAVEFACVTANTLSCNVSVPTTSVNAPFSVVW